MKGPMEWGNWALIVIGLGLIISGPVFVYRTLQTIKRIKREDPKASIQPFNNGFNLLIGVLFFFAGILFVLNNLRGNPLY